MSRTVLVGARNTSGQLGDGTTTSIDTPVRVDLPGGWRASAVGLGPDGRPRARHCAQKGIAGGQPTRKGARR
jgi:hypothetical protein